jgi:uncharacterized membrane protein
MPSRSLWLAEIPMGLCSRCTGIYLSLFLTLLLLFLNRNILKKIDLKYLMLLPIPLVIDGSLQYLGIYTSLNIIRLITGLLFGVSLSYLIIHFKQKIGATMKTFRSRPLIVLTLIIIVITFFNLPDIVHAQAIEKVKLTAGTIVALSIENTITSEATVGETVHFRVMRDVSVNDQVVIKSGSMATGKVVEVISRAGLGKGGKVTVKLNTVQSVDGQNIYLSGSLDKQGEDKVALTVILGLICLPLFLLKGGEANIPAGTEIRAYVEQDYSIEVNGNI